jgi:hypothetical protein
MSELPQEIGEGAMSVSILGGRLSLQEEVGLPFQRDIIRALEEVGIVNESTAAVESAYPRLPPFPPKTPPTATLGLDALLLGFGIYLGKEVSGKVVDELITAIYEDRVRPALAKLTLRLKAHDVPRDQTVVTTFDHWFDGSRVLVRIRIYTGSPDTPNTEVVANILRDAVKWLSSHPVTHRVLTFEVRGGVFDREPHLSEPI